MKDGMHVRRKGISPLIIIKIPDKSISLSIETSVSDKWLKELKFNKEYNLEEYITDIIYFNNGIFKQPTFVEPDEFSGSVKKVGEYLFELNLKFITCNVFFDGVIELKN